MIQNLATANDHKSPHGSKVPQIHYRQNEADLPQLSFTARFIDTLDELEQIEAPWFRLTEVAIRKNPFFDPGFLIPAFRHLNQNGAKVLVVQAPPRVYPDGAPVICGLLPVVNKRIYGLPISGWEIWKHDQCFDCTPLIRSDCAKEVLEFVFKFLGTQEKASLFSLNTICGEGEFANTLTELCYRQSLTVFHRDSFVRACFKPEIDADTYINGRVSKNTRKGTLRLQRKLAETAHLTVQASNRETNLDKWIEDFLQLESSGWKGQSGTALVSNDATHQFFTEMATRMSSQEKLVMLKVELDKKPISMICDLQQHHVGAAFKMAIDESLHDYSPGLIAELENIRRLHDSNIQFMDSCADPQHSMINRVWSDRTRYQSLVIALGGSLSRFATASMPLMQHLKEIFRKTRRKK